MVLAEWELCSVPRCLVDGGLVQFCANRRTSSRELDLLPKADNFCVS